MKIYIASDHSGFQLKGELVPFLRKNGFEVVDCGPDTYVHEDDYPDYISIVAGHIYNDQESKGIVIGRSGQGEAMVANRFPNVRCAVYYGGSKHVLTLSREHNDANVLSLGTHFLTTEDAEKAVLIWLHTNFSGDPRHVRRIKKIDNLSN